MLSYIEVILDELSQFVQSFSQSSHLPVVYLNGSCPQFLLNVDPKNKSTNHHLAVNCELKSTEKQSFDLRLSFNSAQLKDWWPHLQQLSQQLQCFEWKHCLVSTANVVEKMHAVEITLCRKGAIVHLLTALASEPRPLRTTSKAIVLKVTASNQPNDSNYLAQTRVTLVCSVVENLLRHFGTSTVDSATFQTFGRQFDDAQIDWQQLVGKYRHHLNEDQRIAAVDSSNENLQKILRHFCMFNRYLSFHLDDTNAESLAVIIVVAESEFSRVQIAIDLLRASAELPSPAPTTFKLIKVAGVTFAEQSQVNSFPSYKELLHRHSVIDDISTDNVDTVVQTMQAFLLLTPKLTSSIGKLVHFRNESIFVQYNIARIKSILEKYRRQYPAKVEGKFAADFSQLTSDHEWNITVVHLLRMQQLNQWLFHQLTEDTAVPTFDCTKLIDLLKKVAHSFSCYYRNVKILAEPVEHLLPAIATRVKFCDIILKQMSLYLALLNVTTADRM